MKFLKSDQQDGLGVSLTPLVDIIFLLIIFFLVTSTFEKNEKTLGIKLPGTQGKDSETQDSKSWVITILKTSEIFYQGQKSSKENLEKVIKRNQGRNEDLQIVLKADELAPYGVVAYVLGLLKQNGYDKVAFSTLQIKKT